MRRHCLTATAKTFGGLTDSRELNETKLAYCATFRAIKNAQKGGKQE